MNARAWHTQGHFARYATAGPGSGLLLPAMVPKLLPAGSSEAASLAASIPRYMAGSSYLELGLAAGVASPFVVGGAQGG